MSLNFSKSETLADSHNNVEFLVAFHQPGSSCVNAVIPTAVIDSKIATELEVLLLRQTVAVLDDIYQQNLQLLDGHRVEASRGAV